MIPFQSVPMFRTLEDTEVQRYNPRPLCSLRVGGPRPRVLSSSPSEFSPRPLPPQPMLPCLRRLRGQPHAPVTASRLAHSHSFRLPGPAPGLHPSFHLPHAPVTGKPPDSSCSPSPCPVSSAWAPRQCQCNSPLQVLRSCPSSRHHFCSHRERSLLQTPSPPSSSLSCSPNHIPLHRPRQALCGPRGAAGC